MTGEEFGKRVAVVSGAAGGIGAAVVAALSASGATVAAVDVNEDGLKKLAGDTPGPGLVVAYPCDVSRRADVEALLADVEMNLGQVDFLVNNAGVLHPAPVLEHTYEQWAHTFEVNVGGVVRLSTVVGRAMAARRRGAIVTVASNAASVPRIGMAAYCASKAAAVAFTKTLGLELAERGVRCNVVAPGSTDTPMLRSLWTDESGAAHSLDGDLTEYRAGIPLRKFARPSDIADAVLFLLSERASHITMHDLFVDGGAALGR